MSPVQRVMHVLWPGFLTACVAEFAVFALVDPNELHWGAAALPMSRQAIYAGAFFLFWTLSAVSSALTLLLVASPSTAPVRRTPED
ncbi:MAG: hypothetical protein EOP81_07880 [Variovorax sp.]|nr:MAG: hypothetical protein EOP81_07880 [Variovorax sp.]